MVRRCSLKNWQYRSLLRSLSFPTKHNVFRRIKTNHSSAPHPHWITKIKILNFQTVKGKQGCLFDLCNENMGKKKKRTRCSTFINQQKLLFRPVQNYRERVIKTTDPEASPNLLSWNWNLQGNFVLFCFVFNKPHKWFFTTLNLQGTVCDVEETEQPSRSIKYFPSNSLFYTVLCLLSLNCWEMRWGGHLGGGKMSHPGQLPPTGV